MSFNDICQILWEVVVKQALSQVGFPPKQFGAHSFWIGEVSTAAQLGFSTSELKKIGHWRAKAFHTYVH